MDEVEEEDVEEGMRRGRGEEWEKVRSGRRRGEGGLEEEVNYSFLSNILLFLQPNYLIVQLILKSIYYVLQTSYI